MARLSAMFDCIRPLMRKTRNTVRSSVADSFSRNADALLWSKRRRAIVELAATVATDAILVVAGVMTVVPAWLLCCCPRLKRKTSSSFAMRLAVGRMSEYRVVGGASGVMESWLACTGRMEEKEGTALEFGTNGASARAASSYFDDPRPYHTEDTVAVLFLHRSVHGVPRAHQRCLWRDAAFPLQCKLQCVPVVFEWVAARRGDSDCIHEVPAAESSHSCLQKAMSTLPLTGLLPRDPQQ